MRKGYKDPRINRQADPRKLVGVTVGVTEWSELTMLMKPKQAMDHLWISSCLGWPRPGQGPGCSVSKLGNLGCGAEGRKGGTGQDRAAGLKRVGREAVALAPRRRATEPRPPNGHRTKQDAASSSPLCSRQTSSPPPPLAASLPSSGPRSSSPTLCTPALADLAARASTRGVGAGSTNSRKPIPSQPSLLPPTLRTLHPQDFAVQAARLRTPSLWEDQYQLFKHGGDLETAALAQFVPPGIEYENKSGIRVHSIACELNSFLHNPHPSSTPNLSLQHVISTIVPTLGYSSTVSTERIIVPTRFTMQVLRSDRCNFLAWTSELKVYLATKRMHAFLVATSKAFLEKAEKIHMTKLSDNRRGLLSSRLRPFMLLILMRKDKRVIANNGGGKSPKSKKGSDAKGVKPYAKAAPEVHSVEVPPLVVATPPLAAKSAKKITLVEYAAASAACCTRQLSVLDVTVSTSSSDDEPLLFKKKVSDTDKLVDFLFSFLYL
ncbi:hypothetical protein BDK51DRAFT_27438 [Blyttiomyces helicus]|uniref:Uncharacterized protein n=1 Tax=Blyttiomyces helicus TaxID=388810 RepID=A0A4P9WE35_9FUNG|nr:hypothetical protein BDK51DRAFT_27438 [Blyttiomyces helicus]|eukprot:RKO88636.1 hypothetical protein BDK51DRAFT_27438 [Blyttiomyces helicus]